MADLSRGRWACQGSLGGNEIWSRLYTQRKGKVLLGRGNVISKDQHVGGACRLAQLIHLFNKRLVRAGHVLSTAQANWTCALVELIVHWAGEGMGGDGTASRSQLLKKVWYIPGGKEEIRKRVGRIVRAVSSSVGSRWHQGCSVLGWMNPGGPAPLFQSLPDCKVVYRRTTMNVTAPSSC